MDGVSLEQFLSVRETARQRVNSASSGGQRVAKSDVQNQWQEIIANKKKELGFEAPAVQKQQTQQPVSLSKMLQDMGNAANRYLTGTESIEEKMRKSENYVKKTGNFIDIRV